MEFDRKFLPDLSDATVENWGCSYLGELLKAPFVIFAWVMAREVSGCDIRDCLGVDANDLFTID